MIAPGTHMQSLRVPGFLHRPETNPSGALSDRYFRGSGTSEATGVRVRRGSRSPASRYPQLTPDQVKQMLTSNCNKLASYNWKQQGCGELDMSRLLGASVPSVFGSQQYTCLRRARGPLEASRGTDHISINGVVLQGEQDIFGMPFNSHSHGRARSRRLELVGRSLERLVLGPAARGALVLVGQFVERLHVAGSSWSGSSWERLVLVG